MADPASMALFSIGTSAASSAIGAYGALQEGKSTAAMYNYQSGVARMNARIQKENASYARQAGETEAIRSGMASRFQQGQIKTARAASNLDVDSGTNVDVLEGQKLIGRMDQQNIRSKAARTAYGHEVEGWQQEKQSELYAMAGSNAVKAGRIKALGSLMSGASSVSGKWSQYQTSFGT